MRAVLVGSVPELPWDPGAQIKAAVLYEKPMIEQVSESCILDRQTRSTAILEARANIPGAHWVPFTPYLCPGPCRTHNGAVAFYRDDNNLSRVEAMQIVRPVLGEAIDNWPVSLDRAKN